MVVTDGRGPSAMPEERIPRTADERYVAERKRREKGRVSALRLPPPKPLPDPREERSLVCERNGGNVVTIFSSREELIESRILG